MLPIGVLTVLGDGRKEGWMDGWMEGERLRKK